MKKITCIVFMIFGLAEIITTQKFNECLTPKNENGICIPVKKCKQLNDLLMNQRHVDSVKVHLQKSFCGYDLSSKQPKLCCPLEDETHQSAKEPTENIDPSNSLLLSVLPSNSTCGKITVNYDADSNENISSYGLEAKLGAWPWVVSIGYKIPDKNNSQLHWGCGGSLITNKHVLTAAYCLHNDFEGLRPTMVRLGDLDLNPNVNDGAEPIEILIDSIIIHERYLHGRKIINNIALLKLKDSVTFNDYIQPICLPSQSDVNLYDKNMPVVSGWGSIKPSHNFDPIYPPKTKLMEIKFPLIKNTICETAYVNETRAVIDNAILCAGYIEGKNDSCLGDVGGPLMLSKQSQYYIIGIFSYGPKKCGIQNKPFVYTFVPSFINWLLGKLVQN